MKKRKSWQFSQKRRFPFSLQCGGRKQCDGPCAGEEGNNVMTQFLLNLFQCDGPCSSFNAMDVFQCDGPSGRAGVRRSPSSPWHWSHWPLAQSCGEEGRKDPMWSRRRHMHWRRRKEGRLLICVCALAEHGTGHLAVMSSLSTVATVARQGRADNWEIKETMLIRLTWILLDRKWRKFTWSIQLIQIDGEDLNERWVNLFF
jgi:hypothetical protein